jgi:ribosome-associated protein
VVTVNGDPEARRGRQLHRGDMVAVGEQAVRVV